MSDPVTLQGDPAAQAKLARLLTRLQVEMGHGGEESVKWAAWYVAKSLGASTRKAPKRLPLKRNDGSDPTHSAERYPYYVIHYRRGQPTRRYVAATEDQEKARRNPRAGLAAQSWAWAVGDIGKPVGRSGLRRPAGAVQGTYKAGIDPTVTLANKLRYIVSAVRTGGARGIETAMGRGATAGLRYLDRRLAKAMR